MSSICDDCRHIMTCNNPRKNESLLISCQEHYAITNTEFAIKELKNIKAEIKENIIHGCNFDDISESTVNMIIDKHIAELKGE